MVFFTCNACGESLKKAQVDKHVNMCRGCQVLSCIDCGKDFWGDDYKNHIKCISEDQKYGGKGYEAKSNKGDVKQQQWIQRIHEAMSKPGISPKLKDVLNQVSSYNNVPRKKAKFQNWMRNSVKISNPSLQDEVWDIFSAATNGPEASTQAEEPKQTATEEKTETNGSPEQNGSTEEAPMKKKKKLNKQERKEARQQKSGKVKRGAETTTAQELQEEPTCIKKKKDKKRKRQCEEEEDGGQNGHSAEDQTATKKRKKSKKGSEDDQTESTEVHMTEESEQQASQKGKFNWKGTIKAVLRESPEQELSVKKLRKKVMAAYYAFSGDSNFKSEEELLALFSKKINGNPKFKVLKEKVRLVK
ncbi:cell growth-regulating nucleolar protein [Myripristis murdjan]|uniref:Cell growth-regulating nucleolar protein n=1 Tax=Myripristis murdjan TaxID=586833 RepID=A0A667WQT8_9TELE|nr:cell growth-regulating nucleolar protein [Myripristis murdjan]